MLIYLRRQKVKKEPESGTAQKQRQESDLLPEMYKTHPGNSIPNSEIEVPNTALTDLDMPIALRKGVRSCTQHPIGTHISYNKLSQGYKAFVTSLDNIQIPNDIQEALQ